MSAKKTRSSRISDRLWNLYDAIIVRRPKLALSALAALCVVSLYWVKDLRLDASGDTLVLEHDEDVRYYRAMSERYGGGDFAIVTYTPPEGLFAEPALERLKLIREDLRGIKGVSSVVTLLDVPLIQNPPGTLKDIKKNIKTLESPEADLNYAIEEFRTSPVYKNMIVSENLESTAIQVNFSVKESDRKLVTRRSQLREKRYREALTPDEEKELQDVERRYRLYKDAASARRGESISAIRRITGKYGGQAQFYLGGLPLIINDIIVFIRKDLRLFGPGILFFIMTALFLIYRYIRPVVLTLLSCVAAVLIMLGGMGFFHWDVTVVSSNFISLQLILTMSLAIHLLSHYREMRADHPDADNHWLVLESSRYTFRPCVYASMTTVVGFSSLVMSDIVPVVQFGWIMSMGMVVSLIVVFWLLPAGAAILGAPPLKKVIELGKPVTRFLARITENRRPLVYGVSLLVALATGAGIARIKVENSFIDYFRKSTDIYQGMKFIDDELGGTTPLDIIITLGKPKSESKPDPETASFDEDFGMFDEFEEEEEDSSRYWFTASRLATIGKVHDYLDRQPETGKVLSLATLHETSISLNEGRPFDDFTLALLFNSVGEKFRDALISPYVSIENNEARITTRIKDSMKGLRRDELIKRIRRDLVEEVGLEEDQFKLSGLMVLYNNMLQSLFSSQIKTIGFTATALLAMFLILFRSLKVALITLVPSFLAALSILGIMGLGGIPLDVMTITIVSIAIGIGVDDAIHYVYRFKKEVESNGDYIKTMYICHGTIGNAMFYTSLAVTVGFSILAFSNFIPTVYFGLLTGVAMVVAFISSQTLLPALILTTRPFNSGKK